MESDVKNAVENIGIIKSVLLKTSVSLKGMWKLFVFWGSIFLLDAILRILLTETQIKIDSNLLITIGSIIEIALLLIVYFTYRWKTADIKSSLGSQLITIWLLCLIIPRVIHLLLSNQFSGNLDSSLSLTLGVVDICFLFLALIISFILTRMRGFVVLALCTLAIGFFACEIITMNYHFFMQVLYDAFNHLYAYSPFTHILTITIYCYQSILIILNLMVAGIYLKTKNRDTRSC